MKKFYLLLIAILAFNISNAQSPTITSFAPTSGSIGTLVTINGTNLNTLTMFKIGGKSAIVISNTGSTLVGMVMPGSTNGNISITTTNGTVSSTGNFNVLPTSFPAYQQGDKLIGTDINNNPSAAGQGVSVAISADGKTALVGGWMDNNWVGAAWAFTFNDDVWTQQGSKLVGSDHVGISNQGASVSLSADGNTAIVGGYYDNNNIGAAWIFTRIGNTWSQQGNKLVGTGYVGNTIFQGQNVAISADGNTAVIGSEGDNSSTGAAWVFTRTGGVWTQQGNKLVAFDSAGNKISQRSAVAISADGNTIIVGGIGDNLFVGTACIYTRNGSVWKQQGKKLVGTNYIGQAQQGLSVALSADGNTAIVGGYNDNGAMGAAWVYIRTDTVWTQQGNKLVGTGVQGVAGMGQSVSLSADGNTAVIGGYVDNNYKGATWVFTRNAGVWSQQGNKLVGTDTGIGMVDQGAAVSLSADGNTLIVGGSLDNYIGASWIFTSTDSYKSTLGDDDIIIYPNPSSNKITLETKKINLRLNYDVYNILGKKVFSNVIYKKTSLDVSSLQKGIYIFKITSEKGMAIKKFIKE